jgi:hypothetical protein
MSATVTIGEIQELERDLATYHATHIRQYGPQAFCTEATCVENKEAIQWLIEQLLIHPNAAVVFPFAYVRDGRFVAVLCLHCKNILAWSPTLRYLAAVRPAHHCN